MGHFRKLALIALAFVLAAGCTTGPETQLSWGVNTRTSKPVVEKNARPKTYAYQDKYAKPTPRPSSNYVSRNAAPYSPVTSKPLAPVSKPQAPAAGAPVFVWPVSGRVLSEFGATNTGGRNDGINIAAPLGTPIRASAAGFITYAGDELKGYGNLVLVKHAGGYTTAYAHADRLVVVKGDYVASGQVIGYAGETGDVASPQLHFEIRSSTTPVNPRSYLTTASASILPNF
ncbi:MAG TPA: peptidoglycan DD-metalloendopeptidase family protein [Rhizomicrobium sp.]|nr:peptidoglycan DD-metalloendopeptidase family protein [Rhizomicrobium sp.]